MDTTCPCSYPEGWDACPVHRDGTPTTQPTPTGTEERRPDPRTTEQRRQ